MPSIFTLPFILATLGLKPTFKLLDRIKPELAGVNAANVRLDMPLEVTKAHAESRGGVASAEGQPERSPLGDADDGHPTLS
jgi:hypothetical protein